MNTYNNAIPGIVQTRVAAGKHIIIVDLNTGFPSSGLSSDNVHPEHVRLRLDGRPPLRRDRPAVPEVTNRAD